MTEAKVFHTVANEMQVSEEQVRNLISAAFEGGSNYWINKISLNLREGLTQDDFRAGGKYTLPNDYFPPAQLVPFVDGCSLQIKTLDRKTFSLNIESMKKGLELFPKYHANHHWQNFVVDDWDAETADVFLQLCLFGDVIYS